MSTAQTSPLTPDTPFRYLGVTDECVQCERCGRSDLKSTVVLGLLDEDGNVEAVTYYGSTCAARALSLGRGGSRKVLDAAQAAHRAVTEGARDARAMFARYGLRAEERPAGDVLRAAAVTYAEVHRHALWASERTAEDWSAAVLRMWESRGVFIRDAERLGV